MMNSVLVIDDSEEIAKSIVLMFRELRDINVSHVLTLEQADEELRSNKYDAVVLDLMFPGDSPDSLSGLEYISSIKNLYPEMAIIILTGNSAECTAIEALNRGADAFLVKPFKVVELRKMIEETLAKQEEVGFRQALISAYFRIGRAMAISKSAFEEANKAICDTIEAGEANGVILDAYEKGCQSV